MQPIELAPQQWTMHGPSILCLVSINPMRDLSQFSEGTLFVARLLLLEMEAQPYMMLLSPDFTSPISGQRGAQRTG